MFNIWSDDFKECYIVIDDKKRNDGSIMLSADKNSVDAKRMDWERLICNKRLGMEHYRGHTAQTRSDFQRDFDRLVFSSPFRRLQNKTQVFPLPGSIFVHNRLTHSLEVSSVGKSLANEVCVKLMPRYEGTPVADKLNHIVEIVGAACLAHDLGNPPFGHSGERTIATYFSEGRGLAVKSMLSEEEWSDLVNFDGNANSFRLLAHQFRGRRDGGFAMTYSSLAAVVKYPYSSFDSPIKGKFGFFCSEKGCFRKVANELGIIEKTRGVYARHPLVYLMEAADDICYQVMDLEDAHKLKILSCREVLHLMLNFFAEERKERMRSVIAMIDDNNEKVSYMRSCVIGELVGECAKVFVDNEDAILGGDFDGCLIDHISALPHYAYSQCSDTAWNKIYASGDVVDIELAGNRIITFLLERLLDAVLHPEKNYSRLLLSRVPNQYDTAAPTVYGKIQAVLDHISGMTDVYALDLFRKLNGLSLPAI